MRTEFVRTILNTCFTGLLAAVLLPISVVDAQPLPLQQLNDLSTPPSIGGQVFGSDRGNIPPNSFCEGAFVEPLAIGGSITRSGNNTDAPPAFYFEDSLVWEGFTTSECADITVSYCGTTPAFSDVTLYLGLNCPIGNFATLPANAVDFTTCANGNPTVRIPQLSPGTYYFPVRKVSGSSEGPYTLTISAVACTGTPPANASCTGAIPLTVNQTCTPISGTTANATLTGSTAGGCGGGDPSDAVWYSFVATDQFHFVSLQPSAQFYGTLDVYSGPCNNLSLVYCAYADGLGFPMDLPASGLTIGATYYVRAYDNYAGVSATQDFTICVTGTVGVPCDAQAGTLTADDGTGCFENGMAAISATADGNSVVPQGFDIVYLLSSEMDHILVQMGDLPSFNVTMMGLFTIHTLVYDSLTFDLGAIEFGVTTTDDLSSQMTQGGGTICASLDLTGAPVDVQLCCDADAGTLTADDGTGCFEDGMAAVSATADGNGSVPTGFTTIYLLSSGTGQLIVQTGDLPSFTVTATGLYTIHTLVYDSLTFGIDLIELGVTTVNDLNGMLGQGGGTICASLDVVGAPINVGPCCDADAGTLTADNSLVCLLNDTATIGATSNGDMVVLPGFSVTYLLTDNNNLIVQMNTLPSFVVTTPGIYTIHTLVYDSLTLDLGIIVPGVTLGPDLDTLLIQGGGEICAGLDRIGAEIIVSDCSPINDDCDNAITVPVNTMGNCPALGTVGDNTYATQETGNTPGCDSTTTNFADVWYTFNSGDNTEVIIGLDQLALEHWGISVSDSCGGSELYCEVLPMDTILFQTTANTDYLVRVYSSIGAGGEFGLCISGAIPTVQCSGGTIDALGIDSSYLVCAGQGAQVITFTTTSTSSETYSFVLANANDSIVLVLNGNSLDFSGLNLGTYHVWGVSHNGELNGAVLDSLVFGITSDGGCIELSGNYITITVDICSGISATSSHTWSLFPNPTNGAINLRYAGADAKVDLEVIDMNGRLVLSEQRNLSKGQVQEITTAGTLVAGIYTLRIVGHSEVTSLRFMVH